MDSDNLENDSDDVIRFDTLHAIRSATQHLMAEMSDGPRTCTIENRLIGHLIQHVHVDQFISIRPRSCLNAEGTWIRMPGIQVIRNDSPKHWEGNHPRGHEVLAHFVFVDDSNRDKEEWEILYDFLSDEKVRTILVVDADVQIVAEIDTIHNVRFVHSFNDRIGLRFLRNSLIFQHLID